MGQKRRYLKQWGSIFFILLLLVLKCGDLHEFTHDSKKAEQSCTICQLAHAQSHTDNYVPPRRIAFEPAVFAISAASVEVVYTDSFVSQPLFGLFLNKAPPVA